MRSTMRNANAMISVAGMISQRLVGRVSMTVSGNTTL